MLGFIKKSKPYKKALKAAKKRARNELLAKRLPDIYWQASQAPIDVRKVVFVESKVTAMPSAFKSFWSWLDQRTDYDLSYRTLNKNKVRYKEYEKNCERLVRELAEAHYIILCDASDVVSCLPLRPETKVLQLWHACGAFKKWGMSTADLKFGDSREQKKRHPYYANLDLVTVSSPEVEWAYREAMDLEDTPKVVQALGVSRTDVFFEPGFDVSARDCVEGFYPACRGKRILLYAPTFRGHVKTAKGPDALDIPALQEVLADRYVLLIKHHPFVKNPPEIPPGCEAFAFQVDEEIATEMLLGAADVCVTDYSSIVFEYSLLGRPIAFFAPDTSDYEEWRGFYYDYEELVPGPVFGESEGLANWIDGCDEFFDASALVAFRARFMSACDGRSTERIARAIFGCDLEAHLTRNVVAAWEAEQPCGIDVSVVIPAYNAEGTLARAIESVLVQDYSLDRVEVVVVDDSSTDATKSVAERYALAHPQIVQLARTECRSGSPSEPRNIGLSMARGRYVFFLDSDDWIGSQALSRMLDHACEWNSDVVVVKMRGHNGRSVPSSMFKENSGSVDIYQSKLMWTLAPLKLFRRELVKDFRFPDFMPEDISFVLRALVEADVVSIASDYDYYHVAFEPGADRHISLTTWDDVESNLRAYEDIFGFIEERVPANQREHVLLRRIMRRDVLQTFLAIGRSGGEGRAWYERLVELAGPHYLPGVYLTSPTGKRLVLDVAFNCGYDALRELTGMLDDEEVEPFSYLAYHVGPDKVTCGIDLAGVAYEFDIQDGVRLKASIARAVWDDGGVLRLEGGVSSSHVFYALADKCWFQIVAQDLDGETERCWPCSVEWGGVSRDLQLDHSSSGTWSAEVRVLDVPSLHDSPGELAGQEGENARGGQQGRALPEGDAERKRVWGLFFDIRVDGFEKRARLTRPAGPGASLSKPVSAPGEIRVGSECSLRRERGGCALVEREQQGK